MYMLLLLRPRSGDITSVEQSMERDRRNDREGIYSVWQYLRKLTKRLVAIFFPLLPPPPSQKETPPTEKRTLMESSQIQASIYRTDK